MIGHASVMIGPASVTSPAVLDLGVFCRSKRKRNQEGDGGSVRRELQRLKDGQSGQRDMVL